MTSIRDGPQGGFYLVPSTLVIKPTLDQSGNESTTTPRTGPPVEIGHKFFVQGYV